MMRSRSLIVLFIAFTLFSCAKNQAPEKAERPKLPAIDPTDSTVGLGNRILTDGAKLMDTSLPKASKSAFKISTDSIDVIKMNRGGSASVTIRTNPKDIRASDVLLGWDGEKKYLVLPITSNDSIDGKIKFDIKLDSSIEPGLFEVTLAVRDTGGRISKHLNKWVVIGGKLTNVDSLIVGRWRCVRCSLGDDHSGYFNQYDSANRFGDWWDINYYRNNPWGALGLALGGGRTEPNWDWRYKVAADSETFYDKSGLPGASYHILALNNRKIVEREIDGERESFWVFARVKLNK